MTNYMILNLKSKNKSSRSDTLLKSLFSGIYWSITNLGKRSRLPSQCSRLYSRHQYKHPGK